MHFLAFLVFFLKCLLLKADFQNKAPLSLQYGIRWMKHIPQDDVLATGRNNYSGFRFCSCSWKQKNHQFRPIQAFDATPCNVEKAQNNCPKTFGFGLDPSSPILDNLQKWATFWGRWLSLGKNQNIGLINLLQVRVDKEFSLKWSFVAILWNDDVRGIWKINI